MYSKFRSILLRKNPLEKNSMILLVSERENHGQFFEFLKKAPTYLGLTDTFIHGRGEDCLKQRVLNDIYKTRLSRRRMICLLPNLLLPLLSARCPSSSVSSVLFYTYWGRG
jgi:hypothetical protein